MIHQACPHPPDPHALATQQVFAVQGSAMITWDRDLGTSSVLAMLMLQLRARGMSLSGATARTVHRDS